ncbi:hypothetical protein E2P81_ATG09459 [Venturia nashicola]|nr:hypothetical protein E2P81_ATG09459 [Venturia nashicola]
MHISFLLPLALLAALLPGALACSKAQGCCWGGTDNGFAGCYNQHNFSNNKCRDKKYADDFCSVYKFKCANDCCSTKSKKGIECPEKGITKEAGSSFFKGIINGIGGMFGGGGGGGGMFGGGGGGGMFGGGGGGGIPGFGGGGGGGIPGFGGRRRRVRM